VLGQQSLAERACRRCRAARSGAHDGRRERLLLHPDRRRCLGRLLLLVGRRVDVDEQSPAGLSDRHLGRRTGLAAAWARGCGRGPGAGMGQRRPRLLRRHRLQSDATRERVHLARPLQLAGGAAARLRVHDARVAGSFEPAVHRELRGQGAAGGRPRGLEPSLRQRLHVLDALQREPERELRFLCTVDRRWPHVLAAAHLRHRAGKPVLRHRRDAERHRLRRLAAVRGGAWQPGAAERGRLGEVDERRAIVHPPERRGRVPALGPDRRLR
jgi:hypothetical protein